MSLVYLLAKFAQEAIVLELFFISILCLVLFGYYLFKRRRYGVAKQQVPDQVVKAFIVELMSLSESFKQQLFGADALGKGNANFGAALQNLTAQLGAGASASAGAAASADPALKAQLTEALAKSAELAKAIAALQADKAALEEKLKNAASAPAAAAADAGANNDALEKIKALEAKLAEYEVIEDDLANLKKFQQENKALRAELEKLKGGAPAAVAAAPEPAPAAPTPEPVAAAPAAEPAPVAPEPAPVAAAPAPAAEPAPSPIAAAEEARQTEEAKEGFDEIAAKVGESVTPAPTGGSVKDPEALAKAQTAAPASDSAAKPASEEKKGDSDLLSEFEKMLSS